MRTGSRTLLTTGAMLIGVAADAAQAPEPRPAVLIITEGPSPSFAGLARSPAAVIERLVKLPPAKHERALVIVGAQRPPRNVDDPASSALLGEMKALLDDEEYENFVAAATRLARSADFRFRTVGGVVGGVPPQPPGPK